MAKRYNESHWFPGIVINIHDYTVDPQVHFKCSGTSVMTVIRPKHFEYSSSGYVLITRQPTGLKNEANA